LTGTSPHEVLHLENPDHILTSVAELRTVLSLEK
jgi:hypothetical protein